MKCYQAIHVAFAAFAIISSFHELSLAQVPSPPPPPITETTTHDDTWAADRAAKDAQKQAEAELAGRVGEELARFKMKQVFGGPHHGMDRIRQASAKVLDAKDETAKAEATRELTDVLNQCFEEDLQVRAKELEGIAARLQKLQTQLDRRREKQQEIVDLQVKVALNEAEGLGFSSQPNDPGFRFNVPVSVDMAPPGPGFDPFGGKPPRPPGSWEVPR